MAILKNLTEFSGSIGNISAYKPKNSDKVILRTKGGASKKKIKTAKSFAPTRQLNTEWAGCAKAAVIIKESLSLLLPTADHNLFGPLTAIAKNIQARDTLRSKGERAILFTQFATILEGFQLNRKNSLESIISGSINVHFHHHTQQVSIQLPELIPQINFHPSNNYPAWRIIITLSTLPDLFCINGKYKHLPEVYTYRQLTTSWHSQWFFGETHLPAQIIEITLPPLTQPLTTPVTDASAVAMAITYAKPITDQLFNTIKYAGAGKILRVALP